MATEKETDREIERQRLRGRGRARETETETEIETERQRQTQGARESPGVLPMRETDCSLPELEEIGEREGWG